CPGSKSTPGPAPLSRLLGSRVRRLPLDRLPRKNSNGRDVANHRRPARFHRRARSSPAEDHSGPCRTRPGNAPRGPDQRRGNRPCFGLRLSSRLGSVGAIRVRVPSRDCPNGRDVWLKLMNYDEFAFFNQQLAAMLRDGIPLEGALKQLCEGMQTGALREEIRDLQADLGRGTPLKESLARRKLPAFYVHLLELGSRSNDLPGVLTLVADHYHRANALWTRLKGLMVYPLLVILVALGLTTLLTVVFRHFMLHFFDDMIRAPGILVNAVWVPPVILVLAGALGVGAVTIPSWRNWLRWRLPAFREASLAQLASAIALMLRKG